MVDNVFPPSSLIDQQDYRNPPPPVAYYDSHIVYCPENALVHEQGGGADPATEQWFPEEQNQDQLAHHFRQRTKTNKYFKSNGGVQGWQYNSEHQTLGIQQEQLLQQNPGSPPLHQQTCDNSWAGGLEGGGEKCSPAAGWGDDMDNDIPPPSSSLSDHSSSTIMDSNSNASPENLKQQENDVLQSAVFSGSETLRKKHGGGIAKSDKIGKDESLYDRYCHHRHDSNDKQDDGNIVIHHSVDEERASDLAAAYQRVASVNVKDDDPSYQTTVTQEAVTSFVEIPPPHQPGRDVNEEKSFHYGSSSVITDKQQLSNSFTSPTDTAIRRDKAAIDLSDNWPEWGCDVPQTATMQGGKQQHDHDDSTLFSSSAMNNPVSPGYIYTKPGVVGSARPLPHWECGSGGGGGSSSMIGQGWGDADAASQVSASEALTGMTEQPPLVESRRLGREEHNAPPPCGNGSSEGSWDFGETLSLRRTDHRAAQQQKRGMRNDESSCIIGEEELPSSHILGRGAVNSRMGSWNSRTNLVPQELPEGTRVPDIEGKTALNPP